MSRIEDALSKLQAERQNAPALQRPTSRFARAPIGSSLDHAYGGSIIEIDMAKLHAEGVLVPDDQQERLVDQYRAIKRPLLRNTGDSPGTALEQGNLIMIASAFEAEGKTFTAVHLAMSIAREQDWSVVLVDGDTTKRRLTSLLGAQNRPGLTDLLRNPQLTFESLVMPTSIPRLAFLPSGQRDHQASELLASGRMTTLCSDVSRADPYRAVIFDSSPLLMSSESPVLATQVGQVVVVVRANSTPRKSVLQACERLDSKKAISLLLNQTDWGEELGSNDHYSYGKP